MILNLKIENDKKLKFFNITAGELYEGPGR
jgi:hypothetical protein